MLGLGQVTGAKQVKVVEYVIQIVKVAARAIAGIEWPSITIGAIEGWPKPPKKLSHRQIGFAVTKINGRIEHHWRAVGQGAPVTGPKISV